jgi:hypothetical protein
MTCTTIPVASLAAARHATTDRSTTAHTARLVRIAVWLTILLGPGIVRPAGTRADDGPAAAVAKETVPAAPSEGPKPRSSRSSRSSRPPADEASETREAREQRVLAFVREHNPDLAAVLTHLARRQSQEYDAALDDLDRTVSKLAGTKSKDPDLHAIELAVWQTRTRVEMLVAQLMAGATKSRASLETKLREALAAELEAKAAHLAHRRQRSMAWYDRQIDRIRAERDEMVETRMRSLLKEQAAGKSPPTNGE